MGLRITVFTRNASRLRILSETIADLWL